MKKIKELLARLESITLDEMSSIRLMNRIDTKFITNYSTLLKLLEMTTDEYYAQELNGDRVNPYLTTYWDTPAHLFYMSHHDGHYPRKKVRVRTYLESDITFLEVKKKNNHGRTTKTRIQVPAQDELAEPQVSTFLEKKVGMDLEEMRPVIQNRFDRITLVNMGKTERLTIDFNIRFQNLETGVESGTGNLVIIELKRDGNVYSPVKEMLRKLRIKQDGFSKYCIGVVMTNPDIKQNMFKARMIDINKQITI
jgi:hypothetical protein